MHDTQPSEDRVPTDFIPSFGEYLCGTQEAEAALRSR
jgi:hypothetical protein